MPEEIVSLDYILMKLDVTLFGIFGYISMAEISQIKPLIPNHS